MVKVSDCTCCDCDSAQEREQIKERALSSINKVWTSSGATYYPDGTGMVTLPLPTSAQIAQMETNTELIKANTELIKANTADITALDKRVEDVEGTAGKIPTGYTLYRDGEGKIRLQAEATDGSLINSNVLDMIIPYQYDLISGTTDRSFKLNIVMSDGSSYTTNDFVIPEGGGTDVTVTGIVLSKDTGNVNRFHVGINLSDSTMIDSGYISMVDNVGAEYADGKLTISVNGVSSVPVAVDVTGEFTAGDGIKIESGTISISDDLASRLTTIESDITNVLTVANRAYDDVEISGQELTFTRGNGGYTKIEIPGDGDEWEELDLTNLPTDFKNGDTIALKLNISPNILNAPSSWTTDISNATPQINPSSSFINFVYFTIKESIEINYQSPIINSYSSSYAYLIILSYVSRLEYWNSTSNYALIRLSISIMNATGTKTANQSISRENMPTYVIAIYRKKSSTE